MKEGKRLGSERLVVLPVGHMSASSIFDRYKDKIKKEEIQDVRKLDVKEDAVGKRIIELWNSYNKELDRDSRSPFENLIRAKRYMHYLGMVASEDVRRFSIALAAHQDMTEFSRRAGLFLTALACFCPEEQCHVVTSHLFKDVDYLGYRLQRELFDPGMLSFGIAYMDYDAATARRCFRSESDFSNGHATLVVDGKVGKYAANQLIWSDMIVNGSVGNDAGSEMMGGNLIVEGNAGYDLGKGMRGGSITVKGDAGGSCGAEMENGAISVNGNAGERLGSGMAGGEIIVEGNAGDLAGYIMAGGSITIKGDSGSHAGNDMIDGMITIAGDCKDHFAIGRTGGEIHVAGKHGGLGARMHGSISRKMDDVFTTGPSREERMIHGMKRFWEKNEKRGIFNSGLHLPHNTRRDEGEIRIIYSKVIREIAPLLSTGYTAKDIEGISIALGEAEHADNFAPLSGLLMSALINHCKDNDFIVHTDHFKWSGMEFLGYRNTKNIFVDGSTCDYTGMRMRAGSLTINGYGGDYLGRNMMGGTITLNGHAYLNLGYGMSGGKIIVNGDAYHTSLAERMIGGEIHINGELKDRQGYLKDLFAGKIYHKGEEML